MARSYRKNPILKYAPKDGTYGKNQANRRVRRFKGDLPSGSCYKRLYCAWDIHDYVSRQTLGDHLKSWAEWIEYCERKGYDWSDNHYGGNLSAAIRKWKKEYFWK